MEQTNAQQALEPFLALSKSAKSPRAAADLITQATSSQGTYLFAELLAQQNISNIKTDPQYSSFHTLLEIFAWGTWESYQSTSGLPQLSDAQTLKLRLLSLITYASGPQVDLSYTSLCKRLEFDTAIDLEHLVTTAIYSNLITATLYPAEQTVLISSVAPLRDLVPGSVQGMLEALQLWSKRCDDVLADLDAEITKIKSEASIRAAQEAKVDKRFKAALEASEKKTTTIKETFMSSNLRGSRGSNKREAMMQATDDNDDDMMELDPQHSGSRKKSGGILEKLKPKS